MNLTELKKQSAAELMELALSMKLEGLARNRKQDLVFAIVKEHAKQGDEVVTTGVLELLQDGFGFLRSAESSYVAGPDDVYVSPSQIRRFHLRTGDTITGKIRAPKDSERYFALVKVEEINYEKPDKSKHKVPFENLTPLFPNERFTLERGNGSTEDITPRLIDLASPIGKGQRALIVAPPKSGKTMILQMVAQSIAANYPDSDLIVLLIDERPEEVTEMQRSVKGELFLVPSMSQQLVTYKLLRWLLKKLSAWLRTKRMWLFFSTPLHAWLEPTTPLCLHQAKY